MGATAIIVCLTAQVPEIARMCRDLLQIHHYKSHVVEAVGQRDTVSVTVSEPFPDLRLNSDNFIKYLLGETLQWL